MALDNERKRILNREKLAQKRENARQDQDFEIPDQEIARKYRQGPPTDLGGNIGSGTFAGGSFKKTEAGQKAPLAAEKETESGQTAKPSENLPLSEQQPNREETSRPEEHDQKNIAKRPQTRANLTQKLIDRQQKGLAKAEEKEKKLSEKYQQDVDQKKWGRILSKSRLKAQQKEIKRRQKILARTQKISATQMGSGWLLRSAWWLLIPTFGLTWFYIAFHFIAAYFITPFSDFFCKFGEEWLPRSLPGGRKAALQASRGVATCEMMGCILIGILLFVIFLYIAGVIGVITYIAVHPWETLKALFGTVGAIIKSAFYWITGENPFE